MMSTIAYTRDELLHVLKVIIWDEAVFDFDIVVVLGNNSVALYFGDSVEVLR